MLVSLFSEWGGWSWLVLGIVLLGAEILAAGTFLLWFGVAAIIVGLNTFLMGEIVFWTLQVQMISFVVLSMLLAIFGRKFMTRHGLDDSEDPLLNERSSRLIGREAILSEAISSGYGRAKIGESIWRVKGPDLPEGAKVRVVAEAAGNSLVVEEAG